MSDEQRFLAHLKQAGLQPPASAAPDPYRLPMGPFRFWATPGPADDSYRGAISATDVVTLEGTTGWMAFLRADSPEAVGEAIEWMAVDYTLVEPDGAANPAVTQPEVVEQSDGSLRFTAWFEEPMSGELYRLSIDASTSKTTTVLWSILDDVVPPPELTLALEQLQRGDEAARLAAVDKLAESIGSHAVTALLTALTDQSTPVRSRAVTRLGEKGDPVAVPDLVKLLSAEPDEGTRAAIVLALARLGGPEAEAALRKTADTDASESVRTMARSHL